MTLRRTSGPIHRPLRRTRQFARSKTIGPVSIVNLGRHRPIQIRNFLHHGAAPTFGGHMTNARYASTVTPLVTYCVIVIAALLMAPIIAHLQLRTATQMFPPQHVPLKTVGLLTTRQLQSVVADRRHHIPDVFALSPRLSRLAAISRQTKKCSLCHHWRSGCPAVRCRKTSSRWSNNSCNQNFWSDVSRFGRHRGNEVVLSRCRTSSSS